MKKLIFILMLSALFTLDKAMAVTLSLGNAPGRIYPDTPVEHISVTIDGLNKDQVNSLPGAFSLDVNYDPSVLAWNNEVKWERYFGDLNQDQIVAEANLSAPGLIQVDLVSLLSPDELNRLRNNGLLRTFTVFTLDFQPIPAGFPPPAIRGSTEVKLTNVVLSDVLGNEMTGVNLRNNPLHIELVPEINAAGAPVGLALLIGGCLLLGERSRRRDQPARSDSRL